MHKIRRIILIFLSHASSINSCSGTSCKIKAETYLANGSYHGTKESAINRVTLKLRENRFGMKTLCYVE